MMHREAVCPHYQEEMVFGFGLGFRSFQQDLHVQSSAVQLNGTKSLTEPVYLSQKFNYKQLIPLKYIQINM